MSDNTNIDPIIEDTEAHGYRKAADAESAEGTQDTEAHGVMRRADVESAEDDDDVEGHGIFDELPRKI